MKPNTLKNVLENMINKSFVYGKSTHRIRSATINEQDEKFTIATDLGSYSRNLEAADTFLSYWKEVDEKALEKKTEDQNLLLSTLIESENANTLDYIDILKQNIQKVQQDKSYLPQAKEINENVKTIIDLSKFKLSLFQIARTINRGR